MARITHDSVYLCVIFSILFLLYHVSTKFSHSLQILVTVNERPSFIPVYKCNNRYNHKSTNSREPFKQFPAL
jgi:hypothetical protein